MLGLKTAKDELIELLRAEVARLASENAALREQLAARPAPAKMVAPESDKRPPIGSRTMAERCRKLSEHSYRNARERDPKRNLVAEMPPPGAAKPAAFEGPQ